MTGFVCVGDLHLTDSAGSGGLSNYIEDHDDMVANLVISQPLKYAKAHGITDIVFLGDLCQNPRMSYAGQMAISKILNHTGFHFWFYLGNHDMFSEDPEAGHSLELLKLWGRKNCTVIEHPTDVEIGGLPCRVLPYPHQKFSKTRMNLAHIDVAGSKTDSGRLNDKDGLNKSDAYAVIGHIHTSQRVRNSFYPGTLYQTNFGESADKFFAVVDYDDGWTVEQVAVKPTYRLWTINVESTDDLKDVPASSHDLVKLVLKTTKVKASDYQHLTVVKTVAVKNDAEAALAQFEEIGKGSEIEISSDEFFHAWVANQSRPTKLKKDATAIRTRLLKSVSQ